MTDQCIVPQVPLDFFSNRIWGYYNRDKDFPPMAEMLDWSLEKYGVKLYRIQCSYGYFKEHVKPDFDQNTNTLTLQSFQENLIDGFFDPNPIDGHDCFQIMRTVTLSSFIQEYKQNGLQIEFQPIWALETIHGYMPTVGASRYLFLEMLDDNDYKFDMIINIHDQNPDFTTKYADIITPITAAEVRNDLNILVFPDFCPLDHPYDKGLPDILDDGRYNYNINGLAGLQDSFQRHQELKWTSLYNIREFIKSDKKIYLTPHQKVLLFDKSDKEYQLSDRLYTENIEEAHATIEFHDDSYLHRYTFSIEAQSTFSNALLFIMQGVRDHAHTDFTITYL